MTETADSHSSSSSSVDLEAVKKKLRRVDVLSGGTSPAWQAEFNKVCEDIVINEVADLLAEVELLQAKNTYLLSRLTYHCDRGDALQVQLAAQTAVIEAARALIAAPHCERGFMSFGHEKCTPSGDACVSHRWHMLRHALTIARLDAADVPAAKGENEQ